MNQTFNKTRNKIKEILDRKLLHVLLSYKNTKYLGKPIEGNFYIEKHDYLVKNIFNIFRFSQLHVTFVFIDLS